MGIEDAVQSIRETIKTWENSAEISADGGDRNIAKYILSFRQNMEQCNIQMPTLINEGFSCGLCRILDTRQQVQTELMPYLLTAYILNFPRNEFVRNFLSKYKENTVWDEDVFLGLSKPDEPGDSQQNSPLITGIGHLFFQEELSNPKKFEEELDRLANRFQIHSERMKIINPYSFPPMYFIVPQQGAATFTRKLKSQHYFEPLDTGKRKIVKVFTEFKIEDDISKIYDCRLITDIFVIWYASIFECCEEAKSMRPDAYKCIACMLSTVGQNSPFLYDIGDYLGSKYNPSSYRMKIHEKIMLYYKKLCIST